MKVLALYNSNEGKSGMTVVTFLKNYPQMTRAIAINGTQVFKSEKQRQVFLGWIDTISNSGFRNFYRSMVFPVIFSEDYIRQNVLNIDTILDVTEKRIQLESALLMVNACVNFGYNENDFIDTKTPVLIMSSDEDCFISKKTIEMASKKWINSYYVNFENSGHFPQREITETYNKVVYEFLEKII